jgi:hypothetical protein
MSVQTFTRLGLRYRHYETGPNRWGQGSVHLQFWSKEHRQWVLLCRPNDAGSFSGYHGFEVEPKPVTCKKCIKKGPRPAEHTRNVGIIGAPDAGNTTLTERIDHDADFHLGHHPD